MNLKEKIEVFATIFYEYSITLAKTIKSVCKNKVQVYLLYLLCSPYIILKCPICILYEYTIGRMIVKSQLKEEQSKSFKYDLGFAVIAKDEGAYIREWILYHYLACNKHTKIYLYDNESSDGTKEIVQDLIDKGIVEYIYFPGKLKQYPAYIDAAKRSKEECRYIAYIDMDEFMVSNDDIPLDKLVRELISKIPNAGGLGVNWKVFGSSGYKEKQTGLVMETFLNRGRSDHFGNSHVKTIANPRLVKDINSPHFVMYKYGAWNIDTNGKRQRLWWNKNVLWDKLCLHHYFCKSEEEFKVKQKRGWADWNGSYDFEKFNEYDLNDAYDDIMLKYVPAIKELL